MIELDKHIAGEGASAGAVNPFEAAKLRFKPVGTEALYRGRTDADPAGKTVHDSGIVNHRHLPGSYPMCAVSSACDSAFRDRDDQLTGG